MREIVMRPNRSRLILAGIEKDGTFRYETHPDDMPTAEEMEWATALLSKADTRPNWRS